MNGKDLIEIQIRQKHKIKIADAIISATALENDLILVTRNIKVTLS